MSEENTKDKNSQVKKEQMVEVATIENIQNKVYVIRGQQVMLDYDLAEIYGYEVKALNQQVKRNSGRFPEDFMFQLTRDELEFVKSQFVTSRENNFFKGQEGGRRKLPYAFTEQGIYMLATVLRGELAEQQSIFIMRAFREMRHYIKQNQQFVTQSEMKLITAKVSEISMQVVGINDWKKKTEVDIENIQKSIDIINENFISEKDFKEQYFPLHIKSNPDCHDRWIVIDYDLPTEQVYHCGASSKDAGKKLCAINKMENSSVIHSEIDKLLLGKDKEI